MRAVVVVVEVGVHSAAVAVVVAAGSRVPSHSQWRCSFHRLYWASERECVVILGDWSMRGEGRKSRRSADR